MTHYEKLCKMTEYVKGRINGFTPKLALVLGSGLGDFADSIEDARFVDYSDIEGFPTSTVQGHKGRFVFGLVRGAAIVAMQGRVHYYEGYDILDVVLPIRMMGLLGAKVLFLTNASGGVNCGYSAGDFMLITDHIAAFVPSPLIGPNIDELGTRFPDMSVVYDQKLRDIIKASANKLGITLREGVYLQLTGPGYETPAEIRMCRILGADAVGMSTACEAIAARHMGLRVCGVSCVSNLASGISQQPLSHKEISETADRVSHSFQALVTDVIAHIGTQ